MKRPIGGEPLHTIIGGDGKLLTNAELSARMANPHFHALPVGRLTNPVLEYLEWDSKAEEWVPTGRREGNA